MKNNLYTKEQILAELNDKKLFLGTHYQLIADKLKNVGINDQIISAFIYIKDNRIFNLMDLQRYLNCELPEISIGTVMSFKLYPEFHEGDFITNTENGSIAIYHSINNNGAVKYYAFLYKDCLTVKNSPETGIGNISEFRLATNEEISKLKEKLNLEHKIWNYKAKYVEEQLNIGDMCIFWNKSKNKAFIGILQVIIDKSFICNDIFFNYAIKFNSIMQFNNFICK